MTKPIVRPPSVCTPVPVALAELGISRRDYLRLHEGALQRRAGIVDRVQEAQDLPAKLPVLCRGRAAQEADGVAIHAIELLQTVQHEQVRARGLQPASAQARLGIVSAGKNRGGVGNK